MTSVINLSKTAKISLEKKKVLGEVAQIVVAFDVSLSMSQTYRQGVMQELTERLLGIGMNMDDNKSIEVFTFGVNAKEIAAVTEGNYNGFVDRMLESTQLEGGTYYAGVMKKIIAKFKPKKGFFRGAKTAEVPTFVFFITDGENSDKTETEKILIESSKEAIFWQFVGIGGARFDFLNKLDDLDGRFVDNANFFEVRDLKNISDEDLYDKLLTEFPDWLKEARAGGLLK